MMKSGGFKEANQIRPLNAKNVLIRGYWGGLLRTP